VDKQEREALKHDAFVEEVVHSLDYAKQHKNQVTLYGSIALAVIALAAGGYWWMNKQADERQLALRRAIDDHQASIGPAGASPYVKTYPTQAEKEAAVTKSFADLSAKYSGKEEGTIGDYFLGISYSDQGKLAEAEKQWLKAVDGSGDIASLARFSLAQLYIRQAKPAEAEKHLRYLADHPTALVSKENAQIELAKVIGQTKPDEARKMLEPLRQLSTRPSVSRWAITAYGETRPGPISPK